MNRGRTTRAVSKSSAEGDLADPRHSRLLSQRVLVRDPCRYWQLTTDEQA